MTREQLPLFEVEAAAPVEALDTRRHGPATRRTLKQEAAAYIASRPWPPKRVVSERSYLNRYIEFVGGCEVPATPDLRSFQAWLPDRGMAAVTVNTGRVTVERFYRWIGDQGPTAAAVEVASRS